MRNFKVTYREVHVNLLEVHPRVQRDMDKHHVADIASSWHDFLANPLMVMHSTTGANRKWWVIDGQHTLEAAKAQGHKMLWCKIVNVHSDREINEIFHLMNEKVKPLSSIDSFDLNATFDTSSDDYAISAILDSYGLTVGRDDDIRSIRCASALRKSFKKLGAEQFGAAVKMMDAVVRSGHRVGAAEVNALTSIARTFGHSQGQIDLIAWALCRDFGQMRGDAVNSCVGVHLAHSPYYLRDAILDRCAVSSEMAA